MWKEAFGANFKDLYAILFNPLNPELNPICYLLELLGAHHFLHVSRIRVKLLTFIRRRAIYGADLEVLAVRTHPMCCAAGI